LNPIPFIPFPLLRGRGGVFFEGVDRVASGELRPFKHPYEERRENSFFRGQSSFNPPLANKFIF